MHPTQWPSKVDTVISRYSSGYLSIGSSGSGSTGSGSTGSGSTGSGSTGSGSTGSGSTGSGSTGSGSTGSGSSGSGYGSGSVSDCSGNSGSGVILSNGRFQREVISSSTSKAWQCTAISIVVAIVVENFIFSSIFLNYQ